jgi:DNA-binding response OmpR family regulator
MGVKVLVVDDDIYIRSFLQKRLSALGYEITVADNGETGLKLAKQIVPDLIVSDWMMPKMDGKELCQRIKNDEQLKFSYFILLTARDTADDKVEGMEHGADDFMTKPFNEKELITRIRVGLRITSLQHDLAMFQHRRAITELAVTFGHEINNPLGIIMLTLQVMKKRILSGQFDQLTKEIETCINNGNRISEIVKKLIALEADDPQFKPYLKGSEVKMLDLS